MSLQRADNVWLHYVYETENQQTRTNSENSKQKHLFDTCGRDAHLGPDINDAAHIGTWNEVVDDLSHRSKSDERPARNKHDAKETVSLRHKA